MTNNLTQITYINFNKKILFQSAVFGFIYGFLILFGFLYETFGMSPKGFAAMVFITNIPLYPIDIIAKTCCATPIIVEKNEIAGLRIVANMISAGVVFYVTAIKLKLNIRTPNLVLYSIIMGITSIALIDVFVQLSK